MVALPLCASWRPPAAVAVESHSARPTGGRVVVHVHPLRRRGRPSPAPVRIQARKRDGFRCHHHPQMKPEPESDDDVPDTAASIEIPFIDSEHAEDEAARKKHGDFCASMGLREAPDMFPVERNEISDYMIRIASSRADDQGLNNKVMALIVCAEAQKALDLASRVMDLMNMARLDLGTPEFSQDTINQTVRRYAPIFLTVAKDAYSAKIKTDIVLSFLDALRGLGAICRILVLDTAAMLDGHDLLKNDINSFTAALSCKFGTRLDMLKEEFMVSQEATGIKHTLVMDMLFDGMKRAESYVAMLIQVRREALFHLTLAQAARVYKELGKKKC